MSLQLRHQLFGSLNCVVVESGVRPTVPVILCHGYGATGNDLVSLVEPLADWLEDRVERFSFVFPAAPLAPRDMAMYGGRAWWAINMAALLAASETGSFAELHDREPPGIDQATTALTECLQAIFAEMDSPEQYVLGGFSQGAMVTMNAALRSELPPPKLLVQFSGTVVCRPHWQAALAAERLAQTHVLQSHGRYDSILPFQSAEVLRDLLQAAKVSHEFIAFDGPHTIPMEPLMQLAVRLKKF